MTGAGKPFNIGRVVQRTLGLIGRNFWPFSLLSFAFVGGPQLLLLLLAAAAGGPRRWSGYSEATNVAMLLGIGFVACWFILLAALTRAAVDDLSQRQVSLGAAVRTGIAVLFPMLGLLLVYFGATILGAIVLSLGVSIGAVGGPILAAVVSLLGLGFAVYAVLRWLVSAPVLVVERPGVFASLRRSRDLTEGHRWAMLGLTALFSVFAFVLFTVVSLLLPVWTPTGDSFNAWSLATYVLLIARFVAVSMVGTALIASIYFELREIKDGVGVDELADVFA